MLLRNAGAQSGVWGTRVRLRAIRGHPFLFHETNKTPSDLLLLRPQTIRYPVQMTPTAGVKHRLLLLLHQDENCSVVSNKDAYHNFKAEAIRHVHPLCAVNDLSILDNLHFIVVSSQKRPIP